jgi:hypothetical protein
MQGNKFEILKGEDGKVLVLVLPNPEEQFFGTLESTSEDNIARLFINISSDHLDPEKELKRERKNQMKDLKRINRDKQKQLKLQFKRK